MPERSPVPATFEDLLTFDQVLERARDLTQQGLPELPFQYSQVSEVVALLRNGGWTNGLRPDELSHVLANSRITRRMGLRAAMQRIVEQSNGANGGN